MQRNSGIISFITLAFILSCNYTRLSLKGDALCTGATIKVADSTLSKKKQKNKKKILIG